MRRLTIPAVVGLSAVLITSPLRAQYATDGIKAQLNEVSESSGVGVIALVGAQGQIAVIPRPAATGVLLLDLAAADLVERLLFSDGFPISADEWIEMAKLANQRAVSLRQAGRLKEAYEYWKVALTAVAVTRETAGLEAISGNLWHLMRRIDRTEAGLDNQSLEALRLEALSPSDRSAGPTVSKIDDDTKRTHALIRDYVRTDARHILDHLRDGADLATLFLGDATTDIVTQRRLMDLAEYQDERITLMRDVVASNSPTPRDGNVVAALAEEIARAGILDLLAAAGLIDEKSYFDEFIVAYRTWTSDSSVAVDESEMLRLVGIAIENFQILRARSVSAGGSFGHELSLLTVSPFLQLFGRQQVDLIWRLGDPGLALQAAETIRARATADWMARSHASNRLYFNLALGGSQGQVLVATLNEMRTYAQQKDAPILYYFRAPDSYLLWLIDVDGSITPLELDIDQAFIDDTLAALPYVGGSGRSRSDIAAGLSVSLSGRGISAAVDVFRFDGVLSRLVPNEVYERLDGRHNVIIVPDIGIDMIPFAALTDDEGKRFGDRFRVSYLPSLTTGLLLEDSRLYRDTVWGVALTKTRPYFESMEGAPVAVDVPLGGTLHHVTMAPLPGAEREIAEIEELVADWKSLPAPWSGEGDDLGDLVPFAHYATHGFFNAEEPFESFLVVDGDTLTVRELYIDDRPLRTRLVFMSACQSGVGAGAETIDSPLGLSNAFLISGAETVIASLWVVDDAATRLLATTFYREAVAGASFGDALWRAQRTVAATPGYGSPYYWAAFYLSGNPENSIWTAGSAATDRAPR